MREGMVLYDARGQEIWACPNVDSRAGDEAAELSPPAPPRRSTTARATGSSITSPARFLWIAKHEPDVFASIAHVGMLGDWILTRLSGEFVTDPSLGSSSGMFELAERDWSDRVLDLCRARPRSVFPPVVESRDGRRRGHRRGRGGDRAAPRGRRWSRAGRTRSSACSGSASPSRAGSRSSAAASGRHTLVLDEPLIDPKARLRTLCHTVPGRWMIEGIGFYCGFVMRWFRDAFCELGAGAGRARTAWTCYEVLERKAADGAARARTASSACSRT